MPTAVPTDVGYQADMKAVLAFIWAVSALVFAGQAVAAPPVLTSVSHVDRHPAATWTLPPGVQSEIVEVATSPATSTDGEFLSENVEVFDLLEEAQTSWVDNFQLDPGVYYLHVGGFDEPCVFAGLCPDQEFTQTATLVIRAPPSPPPRPRYEASVRSIHPGAIKARGNWTYLGDTVRVRFRNARARPRDGQGYRVCYTHGRRLACKNRRILGRSWDAWRLRVTPAMAGFRAGRVRRYLEFTWRVDRRIVARKRIRIFYDA
jgi:hypothetical protein